MKHDLASLKLALADAPVLTVEAQLTRLAPFQHLVLHHPPDWLFTSGKPNRYNPAGVECVYFGESREVAEMEYESQYSGLLGKRQPVTTYYAEIVLGRVLDLTNALTLKKLKLDAKELSRNWRRARTPTLTQLLGSVINEAGHFSAIRYPSQAAVKEGLAGANFVIFRSGVRPPDSVIILGPTKKPLQKWP